MLMQALKRLDCASLPVPGAEPWMAFSDDPALTVMTDFRERSSVTVAGNTPIDAALEHMKHTGVRCAFVTGDAGVIGLITAYDILGEKPLSFMQGTSGTEREDVLAKHLMQPVAAWSVLGVRDLETASVEDVYRMFVGTQLTHVPVIEYDLDGVPRLRGLLSHAKVRRLLSR